METTLVEVLRSISFVEKALLLLIGAALTGIVVPLVKYRMDRNYFRQQKTFEAELARQAEVVKARAQFLQELVEPVWQFQLLALRVSFDRSSDAKFRLASSAYDKQAWTHLGKIRTLVGGARWFTSLNAYSALTNFIDGWLLGTVDVRLRREIDKGAAADWHAFNIWLYQESRSRTDDLLLTLAKDFELHDDLAH